MKKIMIRILVAVLIAAMMTSVLASCRRDQGGLFVPPEFVFVPEIFTLPADIGYIGNMLYANDRLLFVSQVPISDDSWETTSKLFTMNLDGTDITELTGFSPLRHPSPTAEGTTQVLPLSVDSDGNILVYESGYFYHYNIPDDFDGEEWDIWQFREDLGELTKIRKLDSTGAEISSVEIDNLQPPNADWFYISGIAVDAAGNIYLGTYSWSEAGENQEIVVLDNNGNIRSRIKLDDAWVNQLLTMPDGSVAFYGGVQGPDGYQQQLQKIDLSSGTLGEVIELPMMAGQLFPGNDEYTLFYQDWGTGISGISAETGESVRLINWIESGVIADGVENVLALPDGRILFTNRRWDMTGQSIELMIFTKTPYSELPERIVLTLAAAWLSWELRAPIIEFNRTNQRYRIHVIDYSEFNTEDDWTAGLTRLTTDIIAGNVPDILDLNGLPFHQYVARGLLEDIFPLIDSDPELSRDDFVQSVLRAKTIDGKLHRMATSFSVTTMIGHPSVVGPNMGWNMDEFNAVLAANPQADYPVGQWLTKMNFLTSSIFYNIEEYVNWETGRVHFDTDGFVQLLELSNRFPDEIDWNNWDPWGGDEWVSEEDLIAARRQLMQQAWIGGFSQIQSALRMFGGDIVFKGFPTESRNGNSFSLGTSLAITTSCVDKDGAWEFMRTFLMPDWQRDNIWQFPLNQTVFDELIVDAMTEREPPDLGGDWDMPTPRSRDIVVDMPSMPGWWDEPLTQAQVDQVLALIDSVTGVTDWNESLMRIIQEDATNFFNGQGTARDAARIIQSRASRLIAEQS